MEWISVEKSLPQDMRKVIAFYRNKLNQKRTVMAQYIPPFTIRCCDFYDDESDFDCEYKDGDDEGYVKESWHELVDNSSYYSSYEIVEGVITHWMHLPSYPDLNHKTGAK